MRRTRRHKFLQISIFFLIYSIIHVLSEHSVNKTNPLKVAEDTLLKEPKEPVKVAEEELNKAEEEVKQKEEKPNEEKPKEEKPKEEKPKEEKTKEEKPKEDKPKEEKPKEEKPKEKPKKEKPTVEPKVVPTSTKSPEKREEKTTSAPMVTTDIPTTTTPGHGHPTWRPKRTNCTPPAIEQFPKPLMGPWGRKHGGLLLHVIVAMYTFLGLAIVCDEYFVASLDRICEELKLSPDVAGATFMAAGSSAPELATVIIGVFFAKDDIGVSGVIGSAVFNIMFVISVCALCTSTISYLNWWPLIRDCFFYALSILIMLSTIYNDTITWGESLFMLIMYVVYCIALHFNPLLEAWAHTLPLPFKLPTPEENAAIVSNYKALDEEKNKRASYGSPEGNIENVENADQGYGEMSGASLNQVQTNPVGTEPAEAVQQPPPPLIAPSYYRPKENNPNQPVVNPLEKPTEGTIMNLITWYVVFPIHYMCRKTMPDCKSEQYKNWYPFTFCVSMVWISFYSYFMVWMITIIGSTLGVPDTVMGLTFVAAGVSVPDALSSIAVIKEGYGDMAVSNAVGSNVFDILVCLGLPWFIQTAIIKPGSHVNVISKGLTYSTLSLLSTVLFLVVAVHMNGWKLDRKLGVVLMVWYLIFIIFASMYELNVFGPLNPPECPSLY